jgi:general L-amino acid transport system permease protein
MDFGTSIKTCFKKFGIFEGRAGKAEFWYFYLLAIGLNVASFFIDIKYFGLQEGFGVGPATTVVDLVFGLPGIAVASRRLHDIGKSGWWQLIGLTGIGLIPLFIWWSSDGTTKSYKDIPTKNKIYKFLLLGILLIALSFIDVTLNSLFDVNITSFLPRLLNYFTPLIFGFLGLYYLRIEFSGNKILDKLNTNINSNWFNSILTLLIIFVLIKNIPPLLNWLIIDANFVGTTKEDCTDSGACWIFIKIWFPRLMYGLYPNTEIWRVNTSFIMLIVLVVSLFYIPIKLKKYVIIFLIFVFPFIMFNLIHGGNFGLEWVETTAWGGLSLTFIISIFALILCFPIGMFLALGRRSSAPVTRYSSIGFIEFWRGVPLITVLFMASVMFPMFLPDGVYMDKLFRVIIAITLFEAAYMAEVIRGGLQALPRGQYDAAKSLGMGYWKLHMLVILPQALKLVIPGIANTFLALVKDTPLILVVGLLELVGMIDMAKTNPDWLGFAAEGYVFAGVVFWIICFNMSRYSQRLELRYKTDR